MKLTKIVSFGFFCIFLGILAFKIDAKLRHDYEDRMRHAHALKNALTSLYLDHGEYPRRIDDAYYGGLLDGLTIPFGTNLGYESDGISFSIFEKRPEWIGIFRKKRIMINGGSEQIDYDK